MNAHRAISWLWLHRMFRRCVSEAEREGREDNRRPRAARLPVPAALWSSIAVLLFGIPVATALAQDTDDDDFPDDDELDSMVLCGGRRLTDDMYSRSPLIQRSLALDGSTWTIPPTNALGEPRFDLGEWTIECWVMPTNGTQSGILIQRVTTGGLTNFALYLSNNVPFVSFQTTNTASGNPKIYYAGGEDGGGNSRISSNQWTHIAGVWDPLNCSLSLYVDGLVYRARWVLFNPSNLYGRCVMDPAGVTTIGTGVYGYIDEVRIWGSAEENGNVRSMDQIQDGRFKFGAGVLTLRDVPTVDWLVCCYSFDDGGVTAEDFVHQYPLGPLLGWPYAIAGAGAFMTTNFYADLPIDIDTDGDGLPDWWEILFFGATGVWGAADDLDLDGFNNLNEYICDTNPMAPDTDNDGVWDGNEDADKDLLTNIMEQDHGSDQRLRDTDDDGIDDFTEVLNGTDPANSSSPMIEKALIFDGSPGTYLELQPDVLFKLTSWSVQMWVKPAQTGPATLLSRTVQSGVTNYFVGLDASNRVVAGFTAADHSTNVMLRSITQVPTNAWTFVGADYDAGSGLFEISIGNNVDATLVSVKIPAANGVFPENVRVGEGYAGLIDDLRIWFGVPSFNSGILTGNEACLLAYYRFDDGTSWTNGVNGGGGVSMRSDWKRGQVEDFTQKLDWTNGWMNSATLHGSAFFTNLTNLASPFFTVDSDGDGLPDSWEILYGLDPHSAIGVNGTWGDQDLDGLNNWDEYRAGNGSDPKTFDTFGTGFGDFDYRLSPTNLPFGQQFNDGDGMLDSWEIQYTPALSPLAYDGNLDADGDGWSNYAESRAGTDPMLATNHPQPVITFNFAYDGVNATGPIVVHAYNSGAMDGQPKAALTIANQLTPFSTNVSAFTQRYLCEGKTWFLAFADNNANGTWDSGEPGGIAEGQPFFVGWDKAQPVSIKLTDKAPSGYARFWWPNTGASAYNVSVRRTSSPGGPIVFTNRAVNARSYVHEGDFQYAGIFGLDAGASTAPGYQWFANSANGTFALSWGTTQAVPTAVWPAGAELYLARNEFQWKMDASATKFQMQISTNPLFSNIAVNLVTNVPSRGVGGISTYVPFDANSGALENGKSYFWRVRSINPYCTSGWMSNSAFRLNLQLSSVGASSIGGDAYYFGKVSNKYIVVEAFDSEGFSGVAAARTVYTNTGPFSLMGLKPGTYRVRAYFDQNRNGELDAWESWGFVKETGMLANDYPPKVLTVPVSVNFQKLVIRDRDTDNDDLPDAWEYEQFRNLTAAGPGTVYGSPGYTDHDGDGLNDYDEYLFGTNPLKVDSDGDGLTDGQEVAMGVNPMNPVDNGIIPTGVCLAWDGTAGYRVGYDLNPASIDSDGDGIKDLMEIAAGSDPLNPASRSAVSVASVTVDSSGRPVLKWNIHSNWPHSGSLLKVKYHLLRSPNMVNWTEVGNVVSPGNINTATSLTDGTATGRVYFYRLGLTYEP